jgi:hypothetical protein
MNQRVTVLIAILLALGVPFAQLHTVSTRISCCCPDPDHCKCPDHKPSKSGHPTLNACHKTSDHGLSASSPAFVPPARIAFAAPVIEMPAPVHVLSSPHAPPPPRRPAAPS